MSVQNSDVPMWLAAIPADWRIIRLRFLADITTGSGDTQDADGGQYPFIVRSLDPLGSSEFTFDTEAILTAGDGAVGEVFHHVTGKFHVHQRVYVLHRFRPHVHPRFLFYFFSTFFRLMAQDGSAKTTVDSVRRWMLTDMPVALPELSEQELISRWLDRETAEIDAFIADQERLIELLTERRTRQASEIVFGMRGSRAAKSTSLPGIHSVPATWRVLPLRRLMAETDERAGPVCERLPLLSVSIHRGVVPRHQLTDRVARAEDLSNYRIVRAGDLVLNRMRAFQGGIGVSAVDGIVSPDYLACRLSGEMFPLYCSAAVRTPEFVAQMTRALRGIGDVAQGNARTPRINPGDFLRCELPVPPIEEQRSIAMRLDEASEVVEGALVEARRAIYLSRERRAALITAAVTGQIDPATGKARADA